MYNSRLLEDRVTFILADSWQLLPTDEEVLAEVAALKKDVLASEEAAAMLSPIYQALQISEDDYWSGFETYNQFKLMVASRLYAAITEQGRAEKIADLDAYYNETLLQAKKSLTITISPDCPYTAITEELVRPLPDSGQITLYGDSQHAVALMASRCSKRPAPSF